MKLAQIFTGLDTDFDKVKQLVRARPQKEKAALQLGIGASRSLSPPSATTSPSAPPQQKRLREAEDSRWLQVEGGSPLGARFRTCSSCSFLCDARSSSCEDCGAPAPVQSCSEHNEEGGGGGSMASAAPSEPLRYERNRRNSLQEVVVAEDLAPQSNASKAARHNIIITIFRALDSRGSGRLRPEDFQRFAQLLGFTDSRYELSWAKDYVTLASDYGWDAMEGASMLDFLRCTGDVKSKFHFSERSLWALLARLDRQDGLCGPHSHTDAALCLGHAVLELDLTAERHTIPQSSEQPRRSLPPTQRHVDSEDESDWEMEGEDEEEEGGLSEDEWEEEELQSGSTKDEDEDGGEDGDEIHGTLDEPPEVGTQVKVKYDDDEWYQAQVISVHDGRISVVYEDGESDELDVKLHAVRLADYISEDEVFEGDHDADNAEDRIEASGDHSDDKNDQDAIEASAHVQQTYKADLSENPQSPLLVGDQAVTSSADDDAAHVESKQCR